MLAVGAGAKVGQQEVFFPKNTALYKLTYFLLSYQFPT